MKSSLREKDQCTAMDCMLAGGLEPVIFKEKQRWVCSALREGEGRGALTVVGRSCRARLLLEVHSYPERCSQIFKIQNICSRHMAIVYINSAFTVLQIVSHLKYQFWLISLQIPCKVKDKVVNFAWSLLYFF